VHFQTLSILLSGVERHRWSKILTMASTPNSKEKAAGLATVESGQTAERKPAKGKANRQLQKGNLDQVATGPARPGHRIDGRTMSGRLLDQVLGVGSGGGQFWPAFRPIGAQVFARHGPVRVNLDQHRQLHGARALAVRDFLQERGPLVRGLGQPGGAAAFSVEVFSEFHGVEYSNANRQKTSHAKYIHL
jgi:hypothetical protein